MNVSVDRNAIDEIHVYANGDGKYTVEILASTKDENEAYQAKTFTLPPACLNVSVSVSIDSKPSWIIHLET